MWIACICYAIVIIAMLVGLWRLRYAIRRALTGVHEAPSLSASMKLNLVCFIEACLGTSISCTNVGVAYNYGASKFGGCSWLPDHSCRPLTQFYVLLTQRESGPALRALRQNLQWEFQSIVFLPGTGCPNAHCTCLADQLCVSRCCHRCTSCTLSLSDILRLV